MPINNAAIEKRGTTMSRKNFKSKNLLRILSSLSVGILQKEFIDDATLTESYKKNGRDQMRGC